MPGYVQVNSKVVQVPVAPGREVLARRGAMLAYTGQVTFRPVTAAQGIPGMLGRVVAGETVKQMVAEGSGQVFYGHLGLHLTVIDLTPGESLQVEADRLLCHDASLTSSVHFLGQQGGIRGAVRGAMSGQGLFTTQLAGDGSAVVLAHGGAIGLQVTPGRVVAVDPQAYVGHRGQLSVDVTAKVGWREAVGRGSGEAIQLRVQGQGVVYVQASEQKF